MNRKHLRAGLYSICAITVATLVLSNANGPGGDRTGAPGSSGNCSGCHGGTAALGGDLVITAVDVATASTVTTYEPGKKYTIGIKMAGISTRKGFQATVLDAANKAIGTVSNVGTGATSYTSGTRTIVGHNTPGLGVWYFDWTAPTAASGNITIHASGVVSNMNNNDNGDQVIKNSLTLTAPVSSVKTNAKPTLTIFPNPSNSLISFSEELQEINIISINGKTVASAQRANEMKVEGLTAGQYFVIAKNSNDQIVHLNFVKN